MDFEKVWQEAVEAGDAAVAACSPTPMVVTDGSQSWFVADGACGFAAVKFAGNTAFGRWAKKTGKAKAAYGGGLQKWVTVGGQSVAKKEAWAGGFAKVLQANGVKATVWSALD